MQNMTLDRPNNECVIPDNVNAKESSVYVILSKDAKLFHDK